MFDYGEHAASAPTPAEAQPWPCRQDPFSSFRSAFDIRTYRLCNRVLTFHQFDELGTSPILVRSLDLTYEQSTLTTYLRSITETGWQASASGYTQAYKPRLDIDYTRARLNTTVQVLSPESVVGVAGGVDGAPGRWIDLDGEGIPGVLTQQSGALFYKRNNGGGTLGRPNVLTAQPNVVALGDSRQMLTSLDADGQMDLVLLGPSISGFFERECEGFRPFRSFMRTPNLNPANPNLRFLDVDGDGLADVLIAEDQVFVWSRSLGKDGFERPHVVRKPSDETVGPNFVFADATKSIFVADMTGDGLMDLVRVRNGEVCYWPNLGYAQFGARIIMGQAPLFDTVEAFDPARLRFGDIDGSGTTDIAYVGPDSVALYLNQAGNLWSGPVLVVGAAARSDTSVELVDLLGTGTACLVWSSPELIDTGHPIRYVDLLASTKPHLLNHAINNLGLETANLIEQLAVNLRGAATATPFVVNLDYNARGQRVRIDYGNGTSTLYTYDPLTFLLVEQATTRSTDGARIQDFLPSLAAIVWDHANRMTSANLGGGGTAYSPRSDRFRMPRDRLAVRPWSRSARPPCALARQPRRRCRGEPGGQRRRRGGPRGEAVSGGHA